MGICVRCKKFYVLKWNPNNYQENGNITITTEFTVK